MIKKIIFVILLLCCVGCQSNEETLNNKIEISANAFNETINGHKDKNIEDAMSVDEVLSLIDDFASIHDKIEYYDMVKFSPGKVENDYYAFLATSGDYSYYILVDIYNGVTTFVTAEDINVGN